VNAVTAWGKVNNKYEHVFAPSMVKLDEQFRYSSLKKGQDRAVLFTESVDFRIRLDGMGTNLT
jgi:hypothetical protein